MASSRSIRRGQVPSVCHLCETDPNIQYKCYDCLLLMCRKCRDKIHVKIRDSETHKVVDIKDIGNESESEMDFSKIKCKEHSAFCCLYCKSCDQLVCPTCVAKGHKSHDLIEISDAYEQQIDKVKEIKKSNKEKISTLKAFHGNLEQFKSLQNDKMATEDRKIEDHRKALKKAVDIHIDKLISDLKSRKEEVLTAVNTAMKTIEHVEQTARVKDEELTELLSTIDSNKFFTTISMLKKSQDIVIPLTPSILLSMPRFVPKDINLTNVGELQTCYDAAASSDQINLQIIEQYQSELSFITHTCHCTDGSLWIGDGIDRTVQRVRPDNDKLKVISTINTEVYGMASTESGDILISTGGTRLQQISCKSGQISDTQYDVAPLVSTAIHITQEGNVIVGGSNGRDRKAVFVMDRDGRHKRVYEHDSHGHPLLTYPLYFTSTRNGNIHVADSRPDHGRGRLVVLSQGGDIINIYSGHPDVNKVTLFWPMDITTTPGDNVMVVDLQTWYLHLLDNTGHLLTLYDTDKAGIQLPYSLAFTSSGSLWIGCIRKEGSTEKRAKLYHVTISGY